MQSSPIESAFILQAEDGIRDVAVTGVQTCALPISGRARTVPPAFDRSSIVFSDADPAPQRLQQTPPAWDGIQSSARLRSEERRVGKERSSRSLTSHRKYLMIRSASKMPTRYTKQLR